MCFSCATEKHNFFFFFSLLPGLEYLCCSQDINEKNSHRQIFSKPKRSATLLGARKKLIWNKQNHWQLRGNWTNAASPKSEVGKKKRSIQNDLFESTNGQIDWVIFFHSARVLCVGFFASHMACVEQMNKHYNNNNNSVELNPFRKSFIPITQCWMLA